jgi:aconitate hydratase
VGISALERPRGELTVRARKPDGGVTEFAVIARLDMPIEIEYYRNGGILPTVLRQLMRASY